MLRFLGLIDDAGKKQPEPAKAFLAHDDDDFAKRFEPIVKSAYKDLFETWGDGAWTLERDRLISFFRTTDESSARVGLQQALTFQALAGLAGHVPLPAEAKVGPSPAKRRGTKPKSRPLQVDRVSHEASDMGTPHQQQISLPSNGSGRVGLSVRIEINLPVADTQEIYDNIFRSIRENLLNDPSLS